ncbi:MAG: hypothetical protein ACKVQU_33485 [Burkholderiales bacterium]
MELSRSSDYHKEAMSSISTKTRRSAAIVFLAAMAFAQLASAASGCFGTRTSTSVSGDGCSIERLLCYAHCQAEEQAPGGVDPSMPDIADFPPILFAVNTAVSFPGADFKTAARDAVRVRPPPFSINLRLLN